MSGISQAQTRKCPCKLSSTLALASLFLTTTPLVSDAQEAAEAQPQLGADYTQGHEPAQDGLVFSGGIPGQAGSSALLILAEDYLTTGRLRWQSSDETLGALDVDFFRPKIINFRGKQQRLLDFRDLQPVPSLWGTVAMARNRAVVNVQIEPRTVRYKLRLVDIGIELAGERAGPVVRVGYSAAEINEGNFAKRRCRLQKLRVTGLGSVVLEVSTTGIVEIFDLDGSKLDFPVRLQTLPADLFLSGRGKGTTTLQATYTLADTTTLSKRRNVSVEVDRKGAADADCALLGSPQPTAPSPGNSR